MSKNKEMYIVSFVLIVFSLLVIYFLQGSITGFDVLEDTPQETALDALKEAEYNIKEMQDYGLSTIFVNDTLLEAKKSYYGENLEDLLIKTKGISDPERKTYAENLLIAARSVIIGERVKVNYTEVMRLSDVIKESKKKAFNIIDLLQLLEIREKQYEKKGADTRKAVELLNQTKQSFLDERYDEASKLVKDAEKLLEKARVEFTTLRGLTNLGRNFFIRHWLVSLIVLILLIVFSPKIGKKIHLVLITRKLELLRIERDNIDNLVKKLQYDRFKKGKVSARIYKIKMDRYRERKAKLKGQIPVLEKIVGEKKKIEKKGILEIRK